MTGYGVDAIPKPGYRKALTPKHRSTFAAAPAMYEMTDRPTAQTNPPMVDRNRPQANPMTAAAPQDPEAMERVSLLLNCTVQLTQSQAMVGSATTG
jgi:hypothetical protein